MSIFICFARHLVYFSDLLTSFLQNDSEDMHWKNERLTLCFPLALSYRFIAWLPLG